MRKNQTIGIFPMKNGKEAIVRRAEESDLEDIFEVIRDRRRVFARKSEKYKYVELNEEDKKSWLTEIQRPEALVLVVEVNGKVRGHINLGRHPKYDADTAYVCSITVMEEYRNKGLGRALLLSGISEAEVALKVKSIALRVAEPNVNAVKLYFSCGFQQVGEPFIGEWCNEPCSRLNMVKHL